MYDSTTKWELQYGYRYRGKWTFARGPAGYTDTISEGIPGEEESVATVEFQQKTSPVRLDGSSAPNDPEPCQDWNWSINGLEPDTSYVVRGRVRTDGCDWSAWSPTSASIATEKQQEPGEAAEFTPDSEPLFTEAKVAPEPEPEPEPESSMVDLTSL